MTSHIEILVQQLAGDNIFVAPTWIDRTDLYPKR